MIAKDKLQTIIKVIKATNDMMTVERLADVLKISKDRINSFMNDRLKTYDDIERAVMLYFPEYVEFDAPIIEKPVLDIEMPNFSDKLYQLQMELKFVNHIIETYLKRRQQIELMIKTLQNV